MASRTPEPRGRSAPRTATTEPTTAATMLARLVIEMIRRPPKSRGTAKPSCHSGWGVADDDPHARRDHPDQPDECRAEEVHTGPVVGVVGLGDGEGEGLVDQEIGPMILNQFGKLRTSAAAPLST